MRRPVVRSWRFLAVAAIAGLASCGGGREGRSGGTAQMADRLVALADSADPMLDEQLNRARIRHFSEQPPAPDPVSEILRRGLIAQEALNAGFSAQAFDQLVLIRQILAEADVEPIPGFRRTLDELAGVALLRRARELACSSPPTVAGLYGDPDAVFPCWVEAPPGEPMASPDSALDALEDAIRWQEGGLQTHPDDVRAAWLLNIAAMNAGVWPERVAEPYRIDPMRLAGEGTLARFSNVASDVGLDVVSVSGGGIVEDFDGDGLLDVMVSSRGLLDQMRLFLADGTGGFIERTIEAGLEGLVGGLNMIHADYDNDGDPDVLVLRGGWLVQGYPNSLLRNEGGRFVDVTHEAGVYSEHPTQTGGWTDFDGDGWLDLFIGNESRDGVAHPSELYRNRGDGTFEEIASEVGLGLAAFVKGVTWGDVDNDGRPDLYVSILHAANRLYRNMGARTDGGWRFDDITDRAGVAEPLASFPTWFWDFDNDGHLDLFVAGYSAHIGDVYNEYRGRPHAAELPRLYRNRGDGTFEDATAIQRVDRIMYAMGSNFGDLDADGWLDFYVGTGDPDYRQLMPNRMFRNTGEGFVEVTGAGGFGGLDKGHSVSFADIDNDGDSDVHIQLGGAHEGDLSPNALYENPGFENGWIAVELRGTVANRAGVGARIAVTSEGPRGVRTVHRVVGTGGSFGSNPLRQEIGLGDAERIETIEIRWPGSGTVDRLTDLAIDRAYRVTEGAGVAEAVERPSVRLGGR
ncbi:MAG: CRTAC1 family protein [Gemmatimonadetes bacterium]|nr:CRTAC1 family protein [Gemmatimonadota bacterium]